MFQIRTLIKCFSFLISFAQLLSLLGCATAIERHRWVREARRIHHEAGLDSPPVNAALPSPAQKDGHPYFSAQFQIDLDAATQSTLTAGNELRLLMNKESHQTRLALIHNAKHTIYIVSYHFIDDEDGYAFANALIGAKSRGIDVRVVLEGAFWGGFMGSYCKRLLKQNGISIARGPRGTWPWKKLLHIHDKLMVVDGERAVIGGQNIGSY